MKEIERKELNAFRKADPYGHNHANNKSVRRQFSKSAKSKALRADHETQK